MRFGDIRIATGLALMTHHGSGERSELWIDVAVVE